MNHKDLFPLVKSLTEARSAIVLQALGDHLPMHPAAVISLLTPFFGGVEMAIQLVAHGIENQSFTLWRDGVQIPEVPEEPSDSDELRMGPRFVPSLEGFGAGVYVKHADPQEDLERFANMLSQMCEQPTERF